MTYENIKSIILTILVILSAFLTWGLWTYQPNYETLKKTNTVQEVSLSAIKKEMNNIVKPDKVFLHKKGKHFGTIDPIEISTIMDHINNWDFSNFEEMVIEPDYFLNTVHPNNGLEIVFPDSISTDIYKNFLGIREMDAYKFDRIVIDLSHFQNEKGQVLFVAYKDRKIFKSDVSVSFINQLKNHVDESILKDPSYQLYFPYKVSNFKKIFLPENKIKMEKYKYYSVELALEKFKNALFSDPTVVQKNLLATGEEYTDGSSLLRVNYDTSMITFFNPAGSKVGETTENLLQKSVDFVNQHGGWTDNFRFVELDDKKQQVTFRLYDPSGYPILNEDNKISEIQLVWGNNEVNKYVRSNFMLKLQTEMSDTVVHSGYSALKYVQNLENFNPQLLEDLVIGYRMHKDIQDLIHLDPTWYYKYNGRWYPIELGGDKYGLE